MLKCYKYLTINYLLQECVRLSELWVSAAARPTCCLLGWARGSQVTTVRCAWGTQAARDTWLRGLQAALIATLADEPPETNIQLLYKEPNGMDYVSLNIINTCIVII